MTKDDFEKSDAARTKLSAEEKTLTKDQRALSRRGYLMLAGGAVAAVVVGGTAYYLTQQGPAPTPSETVKGIKHLTFLPVATEGDPWTMGSWESLMVQEICKENGWDLDWVTTAFAGYHAKMAATFATPKYKEYDTMMMNGAWIREFGYNFLEPLDEYIETRNPELSDECTTFFMNGGRHDVGDGWKIYGLPIVQELFVLYYNKAILEDEGVNPPEDWEELLEISQNLTKDTTGDGKIDQYGFAQGWKGDNPGFQWPAFVNSNGGTTQEDGLRRFWNEDGDPVMNNSDAVAALQLIVDLYEKAMPEAALEWESGDAYRLFLAGKAAFCPYWAGIMIPWSKNPGMSTIEGQVGVALMPGRTKNVTGSVAIDSSYVLLKHWPKARKNTLWDKFLMEMGVKNKERDKKRVLGAGWPPVRKELYQDLDIIAGDYQFDKFFEQQESGPFLHPFHHHVQGQQCVDITEIWVRAAMRKEVTAQEACDKIVEEIKKVL